MGYPYRHASETTTILSRYMGEPEGRPLSGWLERGGYESLRTALDLEPEQITTIVKESGLRGRGGAGFPTGLKWSFMPQQPAGPHYLCANADESEPGAFKDREIMRWTPHLLIEGCLIAARAIRAQHIYVYVRGEYFPVTRILNEAVVEAYEAGYIGEDILGSGWSCDLTVHLGAGAYIAGEETGLMSSLMGGRAEPWMKPPFPAQRGVFGAPTTVNNVETLASVPGIVANGAAWYTQWGTEKSPGTKLWCCSGHLSKPGNYELELGLPLRDVLYDVCGGPPEGRRVKAVLPGGSSTAFLTDDELDCATTYEGLQEAGSALGTASPIVLDESASIVPAMRRIAQFYAHESCGQCVQCREGTAWITKILRRIEEGEGEPRDIDTLYDLCEQLTGRTICVLADSVVFPLRSSLDKFRGEYEALMRRSSAVAT
ncbi:MAG: NADH-quinone oxidoreductase subunit NuoF [Gemmatimonadota bacterium]|jgi:NADH-quinone oxidoreductase subunit F|nr:MAG: NADH-quinone oxidoreductase subunit NuoF [Gemmatimonadota bacterium]